MRILVIGNGGREHALVWAMSRSPLVREVVAAPGNAGIADQARCEPVSAEDVPGLVGLARREHPDLVVVGPEAPLAAGLVDELSAAGIPAFGPTSAAARLESSKIWAKEFMARHGIPTGRWEAFDDPDRAAVHVIGAAHPVVVKADGLAAGKGVTVAPDQSTALRAVREIMVDGVHGEAGRRVIIEECLAGEEVSVLALVDGENLLVLPAAQDHKRVFDNDQGPNTGGMGSYSPVPFLTPDLAARVRREILLPVVEGLREEGYPYRGVLYTGLMLTADGPKVLEFNVRFGDPETQVILPRVATDLAPVMAEVAAGGRLPAGGLEYSAGAAVCVVAVSGGYPGKYEKGKLINGLERAAATPGAVVFHAGTARAPIGPSGPGGPSGPSAPDARAGGRGAGGDPLVTAGGRVLGVTGVGHDLAEASATAYRAMSHIHFEKIHYRRDIARRGLESAGRLALTLDGGS